MFKRGKCRRESVLRVKGKRRLRLVAGLAALLTVLSGGVYRPVLVKPGASRPDLAYRGANPAPFRLARPVNSRAGAYLRRHVVRSGETFFGLARSYHLDPEALMAANAAYAPERLPVGAVLWLPEGAVSGRRNKPANRWNWPLRGRITSRYGRRWGRMHEGLDIAPPAGTPVRAAGSGRVVWAGWRGGYGLLVILAHQDGWQTAYGHNARLHVRAGEWAPAGGLLAIVGATGNATGVHLHFEMIHHGKRIDPLSVLP